MAYTRGTEGDRDHASPCIAPADRPSMQPARRPDGWGGGGGGGAVDSIPIAGHVLYVPTGFKVNIFAQGIGVRFLGLGPGGTGYATLSGSGQIARVVDANGDGVCEAVTTVLSGFNHRSGIAFRGDTLYSA